MVRRLGQAGGQLGVEVATGEDEEVGSGEGGGGNLSPSILALISSVADEPAAAACAEGADMRAETLKPSLISRGGATLTGSRRHANK